MRTGKVLQFCSIIYHTYLVGICVTIWPTNLTPRDLWRNFTTKLKLLVSSIRTCLQVSYCRFRIYSLCLLSREIVSFVFPRVFIEIRGKTKQFKTFMYKTVNKTENKTQQLCTKMLITWFPVTCQENVLQLLWCTNTICGALIINFLFQDL